MKGLKRGKDSPKKGLIPKKWDSPLITRVVTQKGSTTHRPHP